MDGTESGTIEELAERLARELIDWERPYRAQAYQPRRRSNRVGL